jgi:hypothetical protein
MSQNIGNAKGCLGGHSGVDDRLAAVVVREPAEEGDQDKAQGAGGLHDPQHQGLMRQPQERSSSVLTVEATTRNATLAINVPAGTPT